LKIVINAVLAYEQPRGVGRYLNGLLQALAKIDQKNDYVIYYGTWMRQYDFLKIRQPNIHFRELKISRNQILRNLYLAFLLPLCCKKEKPELYFLIDTQASFLKPCKTVSTIHDLMEFEVPEKYSKIQGFLRKIIVRIQVRLSDHIITVSEFSKKELCNRLGVPENKITVIPNSVNSKTCFTGNAEAQNYFLFVSETERAKNPKVLVKAFSMLRGDIRDRFEIRIVGKKGNQYDELLEIIREEHLEEKVKFYGYVTDDELQLLYAQAYAFVFPSLFEGFGLPVAEAMANGVPVLCSNAASIPEVGGDAVLTFDPTDESALCRLMETIVLEPKRRADMIEKGFQRGKDFAPEKQAQKTLRLFTTIVEG